MVALLLIPALGTYGCHQILPHRALKSGFAEGDGIEPCRRAPPEGGQSCING